ncbi:hypothetical protein CB0940_01938 [Cercospora beticola]|uniref:Uncharacterized protein n=1 Tax=Cercospora beticola TaxID=122368 RepID=A0A2G5IBX9_CERBT|nr:hypothetical protein CB0940_01938 [Cercospora beticola]PIB02271.1 hypothetical protein CB0940_01938 [Cercospora beticola]WPA97402.1 hypothetical protein RHO25_002012 [Cercospora beticola]
MANQCLDLVRTAAVAVVTHFLILFNLAADNCSRILDSEMAQLLLAIAHTVARTVVAPFSIFAELVAAAQNKLLDALLAFSYSVAAGYNKMLDAIDIFANLVTTAYDNILDTDITEACLDTFRAVARTVVARYLISADFVAAAYHKILDSNMTHQCLTVANTMSHAVANSLLAVTDFVTAAYNQTFNADMAHKLWAIAAAGAHAVARTVAAPFISFANTIASVCAAIQWWFEALICISCGLVIVILLYCAFTELRRFFVGNTWRPCQPAEEITVPDVEMEDAPPIESEMADAPSVQSTLPPIACDGPELKGHFYQHPWRIRTPFGWELINKQTRRSTPQALMQCPWEDRLMWGPDPAWVTSHNSRLLREHAARKQAEQERFEQRKYDIEYAKWVYRCHMSVADKPIYSTSAQPPKADSDSDKHGEPASKPQPNIVKSKPTRVVEERLPASTSTREPIPDAAPTPPAPTRRRSQKQASVPSLPEPISTTAPINSAAPTHVEPTSKRQPIIVKSKAIGVSEHRRAASASTHEPNWTATPPSRAPSPRPAQKHVSVSAQPEPISSIAPVNSATSTQVEPIDEPEQEIVGSKAIGASEQPPSPSASFLAPTSAAEPAPPAPTETRRQKHVTFAEVESELIPAAASVHPATPVPSATSTHAEPSHEDEQAGPASTPYTEAREAEARVSKKPRPLAFHRKWRGVWKPAERANKVKAAAGSIVPVDLENTVPSQSCAPPSQPMEGVSETAACLQPQNGHDGEGAHSAHSSLTNAPSEDMVMADVAEMPVAEPASEGETGMQGIEQTVAPSQELAMLDDAPHEVAGRAPEVQEQAMEDVVESLPVAQDAMPLLSQASLQAPPQAPPAPAPSLGLVETAAAASPQQGLGAFTGAGVQPAIPQQAVPQPVAPQPASHSVPPQRPLPSQQTLQEARRLGRTCHMKLFRWAERKTIDAEDMKKLCAELVSMVEFCLKKRTQGFNGPIDRLTPSLTQNYCEYIEAKLRSMDPSDMGNKALEHCTELQKGGFFGDGSKDSSLKEIIGLLYQNADRLNQILRSCTEQNKPLPAAKVPKDLKVLQEDLQVFKRYHNQSSQSFKEHLRKSDDTAPVLLQLLVLQLAIEQANIAFPTNQEDIEREWFLDGLQMCQKLLKEYNPLRALTNVTIEQVIAKMERWLLDSESRLRAATTGFEIRARQSALCLFARRLRDFDEYYFDENGSARNNVAADVSNIVAKLQVIKDIIVQMTPAQDSRHYQPIAQEVLQILQTRYLPTAVINDGSAGPTIPPPSSPTLAPTSQYVMKTTDCRHRVAAHSDDLGSRKKGHFADSGLQRRMVPTADNHPLQDATLTVDDATELIGSWLKLSEDTLNDMMKSSVDDKALQGELDLLHQRLKHIDEYLVAPNRYWKSFTTGMPSVWMQKIFGMLTSTQMLCVKIKETSGRPTWECYNVVNEIFRFAPGTPMVVIPDKLRYLHDLLRPTCGKTYEKITGLKDRHALFKVQSYWNMLFDANSKAPFFDESMRIMDEIYILIGQRKGCWAHMLATNFGSAVEKYNEVKKLVVDMKNWMEALLGNEDPTLVKQSFPWLYDFGSRENNVFNTMKR